MQLPDEALAYHYQTLLTSARDDWTPAAELRARHCLEPARLRAILPHLLQVRSQIAAERELKEPPPEMRPLEAGFIDLPRATLDEHRRKQEASALGRVLAIARRLREEADRVVILGAGGTHLGARALFSALKSSCHNELNARERRGAPRLSFAGDGLDNDDLAELAELLQTTCVDPENREERWAIMVISPGGDELETLAAYRFLRREAAEYYGAKSPRLKQLIVAVTGAEGRLRELCRAEGLADDHVLTMPERVGERFAVLTPAGLLPAALLGLDARALLLGAATMTQRFLEEPFERNPALQVAAANYLLTEEGHNPVRVLAAWTRKLEALGRWYECLLSESLDKQGRGPTPMTLVLPRDLYAAGQLLQEGPRDKVINHLVVSTPRCAPIAMGMADRNEDGLNQLSRKTYPDLAEVVRQGLTRSHTDNARPAATLVLPGMTEHTFGQLVQMFMMATVVEGRLMGVNPYSQPVREASRRNREHQFGTAPS
jgi:glucose-6-phosphate isomerase